MKKFPKYIYLFCVLLFFVAGTALGQSITLVSPNPGSAAGGNNVFIQGTNFNNGSGAFTVRFGGNSATNVTYVNSTLITCTTPAGIGTVNVRIDKGSSWNRTLNNGYTYGTNPLTVTYPSGGQMLPAGQSSTITWDKSGNGWNVDIELSTDGGTSWTTIATNRSGTSFSYTFPSVSSNNCLIRISQNSVNSPINQSASPFTLVLPPTLTGINPTSGPAGGGTTVTLTGTNFIAGNTSVTFGGTAVTGINVTSGTSLTCVTAAHTAGLVNVVVTTPGGSATKNNYYTFIPSITAISADHGALAGGNMVTITGTGFQSGMTVTIGGNSATSVSVSSLTTLNCNAPGGTAGPKDVIITVNSQKDTLVNGYTYCSGTAALTTVAASSITTTGATLNGTVNTYSVPASVSFEYGITAGYGSTVSLGILTTSSAQAVGAPLTGLTYNTTYNYRLTASDVCGNSTSTNGTFKTLSPTLSFTSPAGGEHWDVASIHNIGWSSANVANVKIEYSTDNGLSWVTTPITASTSSTSSPTTFSWIIPNTPWTQCKIKITDLATNFSVISNSFEINTPSFTITSPNGNETWAVNSSHSITWNSSGLDPSASVALSLSTDGGLSYPLTIITTSNNGSYPWTITDNQSTKCRIKVAYLTYSDASDANFTIYAQTITVPTPATLPLKSSQLITWSSSGIPGGTLMKIEYTTDGTIYSTIADNIVNGTNGGTFTWSPVTGPPSVNCKIRVSVSSTPTINGVSGTFTISGIQITSPNGGEEWALGSSQNIQWVSAGLSSCSTVKIELSTDGGLTWVNTISPSANNNGQFSWTLATNLTPSSQGRVRVYCTNLSNIDTSDANFTLGTNLISPSNGLTCNLPVGLVFDWDGNPARYNLQVATDANFNNIIFQEDPGQGNTMASSYTTISSDNLQNGNTYYWRIRTRVGGNWVVQTPVWSFSTVDVLPGTVTNIYIDDITYDKLDVHWDFLTGATGYEIVMQRYVTGNWVDYSTQVVGNVNVAVFSSTVWVLGTYRAQIRAFNSCAWSTYSGWPEFERLGYGITALTPDDKAACVSIAANLNLSWDAWGTGFYDNNYWQVDYRKKGTTTWNRILTSTYTQHAPNCSISSSLSPNTTYEWIVSIPLYSYNTADPLIIFQFSTSGITAPSALSATACTLQPTFTWNNSDGMIYTLEYKPSTDITWSSVSGISGGSYAVTSDLLTNTKYNWRVTGYSGSCGGSSVTVNGTDFVTKPAKIVNSAPVDGASIQSTTLTLAWEAGSTGVTYNLQVATDQNFNTVVLNYSGLITNSQAISVSIGQTYYWHVNVITASCSSGSGYSDAYSFTTTSLTVPHLTTGSGSSSFTAWENSGGVISATQIDYSKYYVLLGDFVKVTGIPINYSFTIGNPVILSTPVNVDFYFLTSSDYSDISKYTSSVYAGTMTLSTLPAGSGTTLSYSGTDGIFKIPANLTPGDYFLCWVVTDPNTGDKSFSHTTIQHMHLVEYIFYLDGAIPVVPTLKVLPDKPMELPINISKSSGNNINEFSGTVIYDSSVLQLKDESLKMGSLTQNWEVKILSKKEGIINISAKGGDPIDKNGILFKLMFDVIGLPGSISPVLLTDFKINSVLVIPVDGSVTVTNVVTKLTDLKVIPTEYLLQQNYPNPFNPSTTITYALVSDAFVTLKVYDALGREIRILEKGDQKAGYHDVKFNAGNLTSGVYYYVLSLSGTVNSKLLTKKMLLIK